MCHSHNKADSTGGGDYEGGTSNAFHVAHLAVMNLYFVALRM